MKKYTKKKTSSSSLLPILLPIFFASLVLFVVTYGNQNSSSPRVLGEQNLLAENSENVESQESEQQEDTEEPEVTEAPEPTETPEPDEPTEADEQEAEDVQQELEDDIDNGEVKGVEINSTSATKSEGTLRVERVDGTTKEKSVPVSNTPLINLQSTQAGTVGISVGKNGTVTIVNNGVAVQTNYPVVIDPQTQTISIRTPAGVIVINTLPSQAVGGVKSADKPTVIQSAVLGAQDGQGYYELTGTQDRKLLGIMPITANIQTRINTENGAVVSVDRPWFLNLLGFLYTT